MEYLEPEQNYDINIFNQNFEELQNKIKEIQDEIDFIKQINGNIFSVIKSVSITVSGFAGGGVTIPVDQENCTILAATPMVWNGNITCHI